MDLKDWMLVVGAGLVMAVLIDAARRVQLQRRNHIRMNAKVRRDTDDDDEPFNLLSELPNGGARIVRRDDLQQETAPPQEPMETLVEDDVLLDGQGWTATEPESFNDEPDQAPSRGETGSDADDALQDISVDPLVKETAGSEPESRTAANELESTVNVTGETLDWLSELDAPELEPEPEARLPRSIDPHVFVLNVVARDDPGFSGEDVLHILLACDLRFGDMDFFHRHEQSAGRGPIQFSVANMMKPGVFDIDKMSELRTRGLMFFVTLPGPEDMLQAFDYMYETARTVAKNLNGDVLDETRSAITRQSLEHMRQQIRELERRVAMERRRH